MQQPNERVGLEQFVVLRQFRDLPHALLAKCVLDSAELECFLFDENMVRLDWLWSNFLGGVKLCVRREDTELATRLLADTPESFDVEGVGEFHQPRCPRCQSTNLSFEGLDKRIAFAGLLLGIPITLQRNCWHCDSCGHEWPQSNDEE
jgi:hypothetical protein